MTNVPAVTIAYNDLKHLVKRLVEYLTEKKFKGIDPKVSFYGNNYSETFKYDSFPEFLNFKEGLQLIDINIQANDIDITVSLSSKEINPMGATFSKVLIETNDRILTNGLSEEINSFFKKRRNYHEIVHKYGIYISIATCYILHIVCIDLWGHKLDEFKIPKKYVGIALLILSFPLKTYLRWLFPYVYFINENRNRRFQRVLLYGILASLLGRFIFLLIEGKVKGILGM